MHVVLEQIIAQTAKIAIIPAAHDSAGLRVNNPVDQLPGLILGNFQTRLMRLMILSVLTVMMLVRGR